MASYSSTQNGLWNDPATWGGGGYPSSTGDTATINHVVTYNVSSAVELGAIGINNNGVLSFDLSVNTKLTLGHADITINGGGELRVGKSDSIIPKTKTAEIVFNPTADNAKGIVVNDGGVLNIFGDPDYYGGDDDAVLAQDWTSGQTFTVTGDFTSKWAAGQELYVHKGQSYSSWSTDIARFTIASLVLNGANTDITINEAAPVATFKAGGAVINSSRNVKVGKAGASVAIGDWNTNRPFVKSLTASGESNINISAAIVTGFYGVAVRPNETIKKSVIRNGLGGLSSLVSGTSCYGAIVESCNLISLSQGFSNVNGLLLDGVKVLACLYASNSLNACAVRNSEFFATQNGIFGGGGCFFECTVCLYANGNNFFNVPSGVFRGTFGKSPAAVEMTSVNDISDGRYYPPSGLMLSGAVLPSAGLSLIRNYAGHGGGRWGVHSAKSGHHAGVQGAHRTYSQFGDIIKNTSVLRTGGGDSSIEVVPLSACSLNDSIEIFEWTEHDVPASAQTRSVFVKGEGWTSFPTAAELYFEAEYFSGSSGVTKAAVASTEVLTDNETWTEFSLSFTPGQAGPVVYRAYLKKYEAAAKVYADAELQRNNKRSLCARWEKGASLLIGEKPYSASSQADFEVIEDGIITALKSLPELKAVETYAGQLEDEIERLPLKFPAAFVVYGGSSIEWLDGPNHEETVGFSVLVASKNLRGQEASRKGTAGEQGAYQLIKGVCDALANQDFGLDIEKLRPLRVSLVKSGGAITAYGIDFETALKRAY